MTYPEDATADAAFMDENGSEHAEPQLELKLLKMKFLRRAQRQVSARIDQSNYDPFLSPFPSSKICTNDVSPTTVDSISFPESRQDIKVDPTFEEEKYQPLISHWQRLATFHAYGVQETIHQSLSNGKTTGVDRRFKDGITPSTARRALTKGVKHHLTPVDRSWARVILQLWREGAVFRAQATERYVVPLDHQLPFFTSVHARLDACSLYLTCVAPFTACGDGRPAAGLWPPHLPACAACDQPSTPGPPSPGRHGRCGGRRNGTHCSGQSEVATLVYSPPLPHQRMPLSRFLPPVSPHNVHNLENKHARTHARTHAFNLPCLSLSRSHAPLNLPSLSLSI
jgi:hypothetical protein